MRLARTLTTCCIAVLLAACAQKTSDYFPGYAEAEFVRLGAPLAGTLTKLHVQRGDQVQADAPAFVLEQDSERAAREEAASRMRSAQAQLDNLLKGQRPDEIAVIQQQLGQAEAALQLSSATLARQKKLVADKFVSPSTIDEARSAQERDQARVQELRAQLRVGHLGGRSDLIAAAQQESKAAEAQLAQAEWRLAQKTQRIPVAGEVNDVLYREGEFVQAGSPIVSLLPPQNIKVRFFVPETVVGTLRLGQDVMLRCDGCDNPIPAKISFLSPTPEYTAPLIYSTENRATLVFLVEARPAIENARRLHPGQPVETRLANTSPAQGAQ
jgi:HlyD family secretion protein